MGDPHKMLGLSGTSQSKMDENWGYPRHDETETSTSVLRDCHGIQFRKKIPGRVIMLDIDLLMDLDLRKVFPKLFQGYPILKWRVIKEKSFFVGCLSFWMRSSVIIV